MQAHVAQTHVVFRLLRCVTTNSRQSSICDETCSSVTRRFHVLDAYGLRKCDSRRSASQHVAQSTSVCATRRRAGLTFSARKYDHVTPLLPDLHGLRIPERIEYRMAVLAFRRQHGITPPYLAAELSHVAHDDSRQRLRSANTETLVTFRDRGTRRSLAAGFQLRRHAS